MCCDSCPWTPSRPARVSEHIFISALDLRSLLVCAYFGRRGGGARNSQRQRKYVMTFAELRLSEPLLAALSAEGYSIPTPIQARAIPHILEGKDVFGCAQTGTGKTAAFALPILHRL